MSSENQNPRNDSSESSNPFDPLNDHIHPSLISKHYRLSTDTLVDLSRYTNPDAVFKLSKEDLAYKLTRDYRCAFLCTLVDAPGTVQFLTKVIEMDYTNGFDHVREMFRKYCVVGSPDDVDRKIRDKLIELAVDYNPEGVTHTLGDTYMSVSPDSKASKLFAVLFGKDPDEETVKHGRNLAYLKTLLFELYEAINVLYQVTKASKDNSCTCEACIVNSVMMGNFVKCVFYSVFPDTVEFNELLKRANESVEQAKKTGRMPDGRPYRQK